jgi:hypothetical protein
VVEERPEAGESSSAASPENQNFGGVMIHSSQLSVRPGLSERCGVELSK